MIWGQLLAASNGMQRFSCRLGQFGMLRATITGPRVSFVVYINRLHNPQRRRAHYQLVWVIDSWSQRNSDLWPYAGSSRALANTSTRNLPSFHKPKSSGVSTVVGEHMSDKKLNCGWHAARTLVRIVFPTVRPASRDILAEFSNSHSFTRE